VEVEVVVHVERASVEADCPSDTNTLEQRLVAFKVELRDVPAAVRGDLEDRPMTAPTWSR
jgi:hypothetical protein